ncbi:MAG: UDP-N-acetylenolpyruvoylglucosamine reductase [Candidatus Pelagibacter sp. TMED197]|nr:UDP-N-acetylenolpyruvoylglucosamine reductase [Candidatus Pelagibacter sp.]OUW59671.1 MAG: UDP-N-acetylenolpyruvoylglucosamine reductase [Candidatus Pelagibacter sp. TMED197]
MNLNTDYLQKKFGKNLIIRESLSKYSWFNLGGPADIFFRPDNKEQLKEFFSEIIKKNIRFYILGAGSNTLIRDSGIKGAVIKLGSKFSHVKLIDKNIIEAGAGTLDRKVSNFAQKNCLSNMEFLSCIPGSIGGAISMNSGCYGSDISKILVSVKVLDEDGKEKEIQKDEIKFYYRGTNLSKNFIILSAKLKGIISSKQLIEKKQNQLIDQKKKSQPSQIKTGGSTFKNHNNKKAWELIKESGSDKLNVGDAKISEKHCNFFLNNGKAKTSDIEKLINKVKEQVKVKTGVDLQLEIKIIGDE